MAQIGETTEDGPKPRYASLRKDQHLETITLEDALRLFDLPRTLGDYEGKDVVIGVGRFGPYVRHDGKFVSLKKEDDPYTIDLDLAIRRIEDKREADRNKVVKTFEENPDLQAIEILPVSSETTTATASLFSEIPREALWRVPSSLLRELFSVSGKIQPAATARPSLITTPPSCKAELGKNREFISSLETLASTTVPVLIISPSIVLRSKIIKAPIFSSLI